MGMKVYTDEMCEFIEKNVYGRSNKELTELFNKEFDVNFKCSQIKAYTSRKHLHNGFTGKFEKGHTSHNKGKKGIYYEGVERTWFKKGHVPINHKKVGSIRKDVDGYLLKKVAEPRTWKFLHRLVWEECNGPIPKGYVVTFLDGNKENVDISNLELISQNENLILMRNGLRSDNADFTRCGIAIAKSISAVSDAKKRKKNDGC